MPAEKQYLYDVPPVELGDALPTAHSDDIQILEARVSTLEAEHVRWREGFVGVLEWLMLSLDVSKGGSLELFADEDGTPRLSFFAENGDFLRALPPTRDIV